MDDILLKINNLETSFYTHVGEVRAVRDVSFEVKKGEILGIVGESGSGKSTVLLSIMRLLQAPGKVKSGEILFEGTDLAKKSNREMQHIRGRKISMIFQDPMSTLDPVFTVGNQIAETIMTHEHVSKKDANLRVLELLELVRIPSAKTRINSYPHEFSGGMRQRAMIALALACSPELLLADEPTTALDVTIQAQMMDLLSDIRTEMNATIILVTHDLGVVSEMCDNVQVMYGGKLMEEAPCRAIFDEPSHPYTKGLLRSIPNVKKGSRERLKPIEGSPPDLITPFEGCPFVFRCPSAMNLCMESASQEWQTGENHKCSCHLCNPEVKVLLHKGGDA